MATRSSVKLFAVAVLGGMAATASANPAARQPRTLGDGRPACGNVVGKAPRPTECVVAPITAQAVTPAQGAVTPAQTVTPQRAVATAVVPAAQPAAVPERIDWRSYIDSAAVAASAVIRPRVLRSGRPACGNTVGKVAEPAECSMTDAIIEQQPDLATELARL